MFEALRPKMVAVVLIALALAAIAPAAASSPATTSKCAPHGSRTLVQNAKARVYTVRDAGGAEDRDYTTYGCAFASGKRRSLDAPNDLTDAYSSPAIKLSGTTVGWATDFCGPNSCDTGVGASDLTKDDPGGDLGGNPAGPKHHRAVKVGSLAVKRDGALAWIACPRHNADSSTYGLGSRRPNCVHAGDRDWVMLLGATEPHAHVLDSGRGIDPSSLRRHGSMISWLHDGKRRSATLP